MSKFLLEAKELRKTYHLGRVKVPVLRGASFTLEQGEWVKDVKAGIPWEEAFKNRFGWNITQLAQAVKARYRARD